MAGEQGRQSAACPIAFAVRFAVTFAVAFGFSVTFAVAVGFAVTFAVAVGLSVAFTVAVGFPVAFAIAFAVGKSEQWLGKWFTACTGWQLQLEPGREHELQERPWRQREWQRSRLKPRSAGDWKGAPVAPLFHCQLSAPPVSNAIHLSGRCGFCIRRKV